MRRLHLIDGTYELYRAHFAPRPEHRAPEGLGRQGDRRRGRVAAGAAARRRRRCDPHRGRVRQPDPLVPQRPLPRLQERRRRAARAARAVRHGRGRRRARSASRSGRCTSTRPTTGWRAARARFADEVEQVRIMTPDKDLGQCIRRRPRGAGRPPPEEGHRRGGVPRAARLRPAQHARLPGADRRHRRRHPGPGRLRREERGAAHRRLRAPRAHPRRARRPGACEPRGAAQLAATLAAGREAAMLYRKLATLVETAPCAETLDEVRFRGVPRERFEAWCDRLGRAHAANHAAALGRRLDRIRRRCRRYPRKKQRACPTSGMNPIEGWLADANRPTGESPTQLSQRIKRCFAVDSPRSADEHTRGTHVGRDDSGREPHQGLRSSARRRQGDVQRAQGRGARLPGPERRGQVDDDEDADLLPVADRRHGQGGRLRRVRRLARGAAPHRVPARGHADLPRHDRARVPAVRGRAARHGRAEVARPHQGDRRALRPGRRRRQAGGRAVEGLPPAPGPGAGDAARSRHPDPRRADQRPRPQPDRRDPRAHQGDRQGAHGHPVDAHPAARCRRPAAAS